MQFVTYNIQFGKGQDEQINLERIANEVTGADIIALQEVDRHWPHTGMVDQVKCLSELLPDYFWCYGAGVDMHVEQSNPQENKRRQFGNMILSRAPILRSRHHLLPKRGSVGPLSIQRSALEATIQCNQHLLRIYSLHLTHLSSETRLPQVDKLLEVHQLAIHEGAAMSGDLSNFDWIDSVIDQQVPAEAILMGDFNFQPDTKEYRKIVGPPGDYGGRISSPDGFIDAWTWAGHDRNEGHTSEVMNSPATLDYCFVSSRLGDRIVSSNVDSGATGSDHFPVWTEIDL